MFPRPVLSRLQSSAMAPTMRQVFSDQGFVIVPDVFEQDEAASLAELVEQVRPKFTITDQLSNSRPTLPSYWPQPAATR